jgi:hypothetical protein
MAAPRSAQLLLSKALTRALSVQVRASRKEPASISLGRAQRARGGDQTFRRDQKPHWSLEPQEFRPRIREPHRPPSPPPRDAPKKPTTPQALKPSSVTRAPALGKAPSAGAGGKAGASSSAPPPPSLSPPPPRARQQLPPASSMQPPPSKGGADDDAARRGFSKMFF